MCKIKQAPKACKGRYNLSKIFTDTRGGWGDFKEGKSKDKEGEEYRYETCNRRISGEEYYEFNGLCKHCRGAPTQRGFPSSPGFPKLS